MSSFRVLVVCTGNLCRSPIGERLLRAGLRSRLGEGAAAVEVVSAGTWARDGDPMEPHAAQVLRQRGADPAGFTTSALLPERVAAADLVVTATREHRAAAVALHPRAARNTFTLRELARLVEGIDPADLPSGDVRERAREVVRLAATRRGLIRAERPEDDDIADPMGASLPAFEQAADDVAAALTPLLDKLAPSRTSPD